MYIVETNTQLFDSKWDEESELRFNERRKRRKAERKTARNYLREMRSGFACPYYYGKKIPNLGIRPNIQKAPLQAFLNKEYPTFANGRQKRWLEKPTNADFESHQQGLTTLFYVNDCRKKTPWALAMVDSDCHNAGSAEGSLDFMEKIVSARFPQMPIEPSTNGNGHHGYIWFDVNGLGAEEIKPVFAKLDRWLKYQANSTGADIENVEVKGQPPVVEWENNRCQRITYGQFAKYPRNSIATAPRLSALQFLADPAFDVPAKTETPHETDEPEKVVFRSGGSNNGGHRFNFKDMAKYREQDFALFHKLTGGRDYLPTNRDTKARPEDWHIFCCFPGA